MELRIKKLNEYAVTPSRANPGDAGLDLTSTFMSYDADTQIVTYSTGLAVEIPVGYVGLIFPRSSVYKTGMQMTNSVGVIDSGYRGELMVKFRWVNQKSSFYLTGERVAQLVIVPIPSVRVSVVEELNSSVRGEGGFGSSGV